MNHNISEISRTLAKFDCALILKESHTASLFIK